MLSKVGAARAHDRDVARAGASGSSRRRTTPPSSPSATWSAPASTSSPTAKSGARAIPTASPPRSKASTSRIPAIVKARSGTDGAGAARGRQDAPCRRRWKCATCSSCAQQHRSYRQDHAARSVHHEPAGEGRVLQGHRGAWRWTWRRRSTKRRTIWCAAGADVIQLDEPWVRNNPEAARRYAVKAINRALQGIKVPTVVHLCFGYAAVVPGETKPHGLFVPGRAGRHDGRRPSRSKARSRRSTSAC